MNETSSAKMGEASDNESQEAGVEKPARRLQDGIKSKDPTRKMNLDRRQKNRERRTMDNTDYKGPSRRFTIDRRMATKDRRNEE